MSERDPTTEYTLWRSPEELSGSAAGNLREFADGAWRPPGWANRREFLALVGASAALAGLTGCSDRPDEEKIVPYVRQPEQVVPGNPLMFATAMPLGGYGRGVLVESHEGRPTKVEGNPDHPSSPGGGSDVFMQASILQLYDPDRSKSVTRAGQPSHWGAFASELRRRIDAKRAAGGAGIAILTGIVTSPSLGARINEVRRLFPKATWHQYEPSARVNTAAGAVAAFGRAVNTVYQFERAKVIVSLDADFLSDDPLSVRYARHFANARRVRRGRTDASRLYVAESTLSLAGSMADRRIPVRPAVVERVAWKLASLVGVANAPGEEPTGDAEVEGFVAAAAADLRKNPGACVVVAGEAQPPAVHALAHAINQQLGGVGKTVVYTEPVEVRSDDVTASLKELVTSMEAGRVDVLLILGGNPAHASPGDVAFKAALERMTTARDTSGELAHFTAHLGLYDDETSYLCQWHVPEAHYLETWGDVRAPDGTASVIQPLISPLFGGRSAGEVLAVLTAQGDISPYEAVRDHWRRQATGGDFEQWWATALRRGTIEGTAAKPVQVAPAKLPAKTALIVALGTVDVVIRLDWAVWDGSFANLTWMQELPRPFTKLVWDNAALMSPRTAGRLNVNDGDVVKLTAGEVTVEAPAMILPGLPDETITVHLGYGRTRAGSVATAGAGEWGRRGFDAYPLRRGGSPWHTAGANVTKTGATWRLVTTRNHHAMEALRGLEHGRVTEERLKPDVVASPDDDVETKNRQLVRVVSLSRFAKDPNAVKELGGEAGRRVKLSLYPDSWDYSQGPQWGMSIDLQTCIGCNACVIACQAENNIATVGKQEVSRQREMHWIRIDSYFAGTLDRPSVYHQPVPCMHCENAPCEYVCPTGATTHSTQGLNEMTYNRCIGTRYCSNNCPYKVRRFNFFAFGYESSKGSTQLQKNPEVTVRTRGVMEKCSYCVQRINRTRIEVEKTVVELTEQARLAANDDERKRLNGQADARRFAVYEGLRTACEQACPTGAIVFGDIREPRSQVSMLKAQPHDYTLLDELTTRPRTSYLARFTNATGDGGEGAA